MMLLNIFVTIRVDSMMLLEEGFEVVSVDASDKMLKQAYKTRWERRKEEIYDKWGENNADLVRGAFSSFLQSSKTVVLNCRSFQNCSSVILKSNFKSSPREPTNRF